VTVLIGYWIARIVPAPFSRACLLWLLLLRHVQAQWKLSPSARPALSSNLANSVSSMLGMCLNHLEFDIEPTWNQHLIPDAVDPATGVFNDAVLAAQVMLDTMHVLPTLDPRQRLGSVRTEQCNHQGGGFDRFGFPHIASH